MDPELTSLFSVVAIVALHSRLISLSLSVQCHCLSESHTRQMALFRDDPSKFMDQYSRDFQAFFMEVMKRKGGVRVKANTVYQEVVADRTHIHMNSTKWETLGVFVQYLGKQGLCRVDQTDQGWWVQYIDRDPRVLARQEELAKRAEMNLDEEERASRAIQRQVEEATKAEEEGRARLRAEAIARGELLDDDDLEAHEGDSKAAPVDLMDRGEDEKIVFSLGGAHPAQHGPTAAAASSSAAASAASSAASTAAASSSAATSSPAGSSSLSSSPAAAASSAAPSLPLSKPAAPFSMSFARPSLLSAFGGGSGGGGGGDSAGGDESKSLGGGAATDAGSKRKAPSASSHLSTLDALMAENERTKAQEQALKKQKTDSTPVPAPAASSSSSAASASASSHRLDYWLSPNIVVKILNRKLLGGALYKSKALVLRVKDRYVGELKLLAPGVEGAPPGTILQMDQADLESVLPAIGKLVRVVNGPYSGEIAVLLELNEAKYTATIRIESGLLRGKEVSGVEYEDICKLNEA